MIRSVFLLHLLLPLLGLTAAVAEGDPQKAAAITPATSETKLPTVLLEAKESIVSDRKVACTMRLVSSETARKTGALSGLVRIHGGVSQGFPKKSYGLTLKTPVQCLDMRESAHWVLNAAFIDRSLMRHKLAYDLFRSLSGTGGKRYAAQSRFVEVHLNGEYQGAYLLMERVDRALLELSNYDSNAPNHACIYKAVDHAANFSHPGHAGYEQREPDPLLQVSWGPLNDFNQFVSRVADSQFNDPQKGIGARLDLDNAIDFHLLVLLTSNMDGITKNFILARDTVQSNAPPPRFFFAPWDYDATFGRNWDATRVEPSAWLSNHLFDRLHANPPFRKRFTARWRQLRQREFSVATIYQLIEQNAQTLGEAVRRNTARWSTFDGSYPDHLTFQEDVAQMKQWTLARLQWLDAEITRRAQSP